MESVRELSPQDIVRLRDAGEVVLVHAAFPRAGDASMGDRTRVAGAPLVGLCAAVAESFSGPIDDNLVLPLAATACASAGVVGFGAAVKDASSVSSTETASAPQSPTNRLRS